MTGRTDRLYNLLPAIHRIRDAEKGYPLRALLRVIAEQVNIVEGDIDQLYDNWFIETCEDWVVPYIGDLVGYRGGNEVGESGGCSRSRDRILAPRRDVADTIRNRRRKGSLALLEELAADVAGWPARAVEFYRLLGWTQNINHPALKRGATADLRNIVTLDRIDGPHDEAAHTVDVRRISSASRQGRFSVPSVGLYLWRLKSYSLTDAPAHCNDRQRNQYTFSILSNDSPLFAKTMDEPSPTHIAGELNVPAVIRRVSLQENLMDYYGAGKSFVIYRDTTDHPVRAEDIVVTDLTDWEYQPTGHQVAVDPELGRIAFSARRPPEKRVRVSYHYGFPADLGGGTYERTVRRVPHVIKVGAKQKIKTLNDAIHEWRRCRERGECSDAAIEITDNGSYKEPGAIELYKGERLELRAAVGKRPVVRLSDANDDQSDAMQVFGYDKPFDPKRDVEAESYEEESDGEAIEPNAVQGAGQDADEEYREPDGGDVVQEIPEELDCDARRNARLVLDGLLITGRGIRLKGSLESVIIRQCTLVPGWSLDCDCMPEHGSEPSLDLIDCTARVEVEHSILGAIRVVQSEVGTEPLAIRINDSILDATDPELEAIGSPGCPVAHVALTIRRTTVIGKVEVHSIELAENSIFDGVVKVARRQIGCVRFCYVAPGSRTPRRYNCQPDMVMSAAQTDIAKLQESLRVRPQFNSVRYGTPEYCQLSQECAIEIRRGADTESEMGVYHNLFKPQSEANLRARLDEFTPAGMNVGIIFSS